MMTALAVLVSLVAQGTLRAEAFVLQPKRAAQESSIAHAVFAAGRLWILSDDGELSSIREGEKTRTVEDLRDPVVELCRRGLNLTALTCKRDRCDKWTLRQLDGRDWKVYDEVRTLDDDLVGVACDAESITLLTSRRLIDLARNEETSVRLSDELSPELVVTTLNTPRQLFVGANEGEWGGGLWRVDRRTGKVEPIQRNETGELCAGPLNKDCDPVNGIVFEPWKPECVAIGIGLVHFLSSGRIAEVCGDQPRTLYAKQYGTGRAANRDEPLETVSFFGLVVDGDELRAVGIDGIYRIGPHGEASSIPLPRFERVGGIEVSFELPRVVLIYTAINERHSISGAVPLIVPR